MQKGLMKRKLKRYCLKNRFQIFELAKSILQIDFDDMLMPENYFYVAIMQVVLVSD